MAEITQSPLTRRLRRAWWAPWRRVEIVDSNISDLRSAGHSMIASAARLTSSKSDKDTPSRLAQDWMSEAWSMFDIVGELHFLATTLARRAGKARFYVGTVDGFDVTEIKDPALAAKDGEQIDKDVARVHRKALKVFGALGDGFIGLGELIERAFLNQYIVGACYLVGAPQETWDRKKGTTLAEVRNVPIDSLVWKLLSVNEFTVNGDNYELRRAGAVAGDTRRIITFPKSSLYVVSFWEGHPADSSMPDSPVRATLPVLRELVGLTQHVSAQIDSRLAGAGMLFIRSSVSRALKLARGLPEEGPEDPFTSLLVEAMLTPIADRDSAAAVVPLVVTVPDETTDLPTHVTFAKPLDEQAVELRAEAIRRAALSLDAPPELLLGQGTTSHWTAWLTAEEVVESHIEPTLGTLARGLTTAYLRPVLRGAGVPEAQLKKLAIWYDASDLKVKANIGADARELYGMGLLDDETVRRSNGFDESDAPKKEDDRERAIEIVTRLVEANPGLMNRPGLDVMVDQITALLQGNPQSGLSASRAAVQSSGSAEIAATDSGAEEDAAPAPAAGAARQAPGVPAAGGAGTARGARRAPQTSAGTPGLPETLSVDDLLAEFATWDSEQLQANPDEQPFQEFTALPEERAAALASAAPAEGAK